MSSNVITRIAKLLALAHNSGATEAEAALAATKVQELLQDYGLTLAQVEAASGNALAADDHREKRATSLSAARPWMTTLMQAIADGNFCLHQTIVVKQRKRHLLVGRELNVSATLMTYEYLVQALRRALNEHGYVVAVGNKYDPDGTAFLEGAANRLAERLAERKREREAESAAKAAEAPAGNGSHRELVLSDVYGSEADLNNDALNGYPRGTTAARRRERQAKQAAQQARHDELVAEGLDSTEAWYVAYGYGAERAKELSKAWKRSSRSRSSGRSRSWSRGARAEYRKIHSAAYRAGSAAGSQIGLDEQVTAARRPRLGAR